jgi:hypothetical protein
MPDDIINKVISLISREGDSASDKDLLFKQLAKELSQSKYARFYRVRQGEADISLGQFFYSVYKLIYPLQVFLRDPAKDARVRQVTLEAFLDKPTMELIKRLTPEALVERKKTVGDELAQQLEDDLASLNMGFDSPRIAAADKCNNLIGTMKQFLFFNFYGLLKKFDPDLIEGSFSTPPKIVSIEAAILAQDLSSFLSVFTPLEAGEDWKTVFEILKYCKGGAEVVPLAQWNSLLTSLADMRHSKTLEIICKFAADNPVLEIKSTVPRETLSASWLERKTTEIREIINGIAGSQRDAQISAMANAVFGSPHIVRLGFYNTDKGKTLVDKNLESYYHASALNFLDAFIEDYLSKEIHELCDILLVRGQWTNIASSRQMSDSFHTVSELLGVIAALDDSLSETGNNGPRLRAALPRVDRDKTQIRYINNIIIGLNEEVLDIIGKAVPALIVLGKHFKS